MNHDIGLTTLNGVKTALLLPVIPDDAPDAVREGIARRRLIMATGTCPCGAVRNGPNRAQRRRMARDRAQGRPGRIWHLEVLHDDDCPATDDALTAAVTAWRNGGAS